MSLFDPRMMDPSKLKPETLMKMSQLIQELPAPMLSRMQTIMHNTMAGFDVRHEVEAFERELPAGFRERMAKILYEAHGAIPVEPAAASATIESQTFEIEKPISTPRDARLTVLKAVASGEITPDQALDVLFPEGS